MRFDYQSWQLVDAEKHTDKLMISASDGDFTWGQIHTRAMHLKQQFTGAGASQSHPVVLYGHKQSDMIAGMLACMMGDIPFVPVDTLMPKDRVNAIIKRSGACVVLDCALDSAVDCLNPIPDATPISLSEKVAYILFTSGSTGEPKGVCVTQKNLASFSRWMVHDFDLTADDVFLNQAVFSFDLSVTEIVSAFSVGGTLVCLTADDTPETIMPKLQDYGVSVWVSTPSFMRQFLLHDGFDSVGCPAIKTIWFCGEALPLQTASVLKRRFGDKARVFNNYGPTEATVAFTSLEMTDKWLDGGVVPIGYPMAGGQVDIDTPDNHGQGEIILVGDSVALGYLNQPELTAEKFINTELNGKLTRAYRTGDMGYKVDGLLYYGGRSDDQLKLHGYRIEMGDIENALSGIQGCTGSAVLPLMRQGRVVRLVGVVAGNVTLSQPDIKSRLEQSVPDYMVPSEIVVVDVLPLTLNGKVDKRQLLERYKNGELTS